MTLGPPASDGPLQGVTFVLLGCLGLVLGFAGVRAFRVRACGLFSTFLLVTGELVTVGRCMCLLVAIVGL